MDVLTKGNKKVAKTVLCWSLPPVISCLNCVSCQKDCYAKHPYRAYPVVKKAWDRNFAIAKSGAFVDSIKNQLRVSKKCRFVRIHVAGDFFSQEYINQWVDIAKAFPGIKFYSYSKVFDILDLSEFNSLPNVNVIDSIAFDGGPNFGKADRVKMLNDNGYRVCPAVKNKTIHCGKNCFICMKIEKVCFNWHR